MHYHVMPFAWIRSAILFKNGILPAENEILAMVVCDTSHCTHRWLFWNKNAIEIQFYLETGDKYFDFDRKFSEQFCY